MTLSTKALREKRHSIAMQMRSMVEAAGEAGLSAEQNAQFDAMEADCKKIEDTVRTIERAEAQSEGVGAVIDRDLRDEFRANPKTAGDQITRRDRDLAFRAWAMGGTKQGAPEEFRVAAEKCGVDIRAKEFAIPLDLNPPRTLKDAITRATTTAQSVTTTGGGHVIPNEMMAAIDIALLAYGGMREVANVVRTQTGATWPIPTVDDTTNKSVILAINTAADVEALIFGQYTMGAYKYSTSIVKVPMELAQDSATNLPALIGNLLGLRAARGTNNHFTVGHATGQPEGVVTGSLVGATASDVNTFTYANLATLYGSVDPAYRASPSCAWMMSDTTATAVKKLLDGSNRPLWLPALSGIAGDFPDTILGKRVVINQDVVSIASATTGTGALKVMVFGDFSKYFIRDVAELNILRLNERYAELGQVAFIGFHRHDGKTVVASTNVAPLKHLITKAT